MAGVGGFFLKGLAGSLQGMPQRIYEIKWRAKQEKKLKDKEDELRERMSLFTAEIDELGKDKYYSKDDIAKLNTMLLAGGAEFKAIAGDAYSHIKGLHETAVEQEFKLLDSALEMLGGLNLENLDEAFDEIRGFIKSEDGLNRLNAYEGLLKRQLEAEEAQPQIERFATPGEVIGKYPDATPKHTAQGWIPEFPKPEEPTMADEKTAVSLLRTFINATSEQFNAHRTRIEQNSGLDLSAYTQDILRETGDELYNLYNTPEEVMANVKAPEGLTVMPKRDSKTGKYYGGFQKETAPIQTPEEEMREYYQKQFGTFKRNLLSGINDLGFIISPENRDKYLSITFEEYMQFMQGEIPERFKDDITVTDKTTGKKQSIKGETIADKLLEKVGLQKIPVEEVGGALGETVSPTEVQPEATEQIPEILTPEIPTPKVPAGSKEAMIPLMSKQELEDAMEGLDPSDPMYKIIYDVAVERGYIKK